VHDPELDRIAERVVRAGAAPAASVAAAVLDDGAWQLGTGHAGGAGALGPAPIYDLASVTKPFVATAAARLAARGVLSLETPLGALLPEAQGTPSAEVPFVLFLAHRAGLEAHRTLFAPLLRGEAFERGTALREAAAARRAGATGSAPPDGFSPLYSDLGYVLAGAALERLTGLELGSLVEREVCVPLALEVRTARAWFARDAEFLAHVAPTELVPFRGGSVRGAVHDENAWALAGYGLAGQAGLFGTAESVARFGTALLDAARGHAPGWLSAAELAPLVTPRPGGSLRAGFDGKSGPTPAAGERASEETFGHLGFTGTSLWCDPRAGRVSVLLSNRVCPTRDNVAIRALRPGVHDALFGFRPFENRAAAGPKRGLVSGDQR
jgi:CubicO group peptidase (beta-lactamase class C family)